MNMDQDDYDNEIAEYHRRLNIMSKQVETYQEELLSAKKDNQLLLNKLKSAEKDSLNIRKIMTDNITQSNERIQGLLSENEKLKGIIRSNK